MPRYGLLPVLFLTGAVFAQDGWRTHQTQLDRAIRQVDRATGKRAVEDLLAAALRANPGPEEEREIHLALARGFRLVGQAKKAAEHANAALKLSITGISWEMSDAEEEARLACIALAVDADQALSHAYRYYFSALTRPDRRDERALIALREIVDWSMRAGRTIETARMSFTSLRHAITTQEIATDSEWIVSCAARMARMGMTASAVGLLDKLAEKNPLEPGSAAASQAALVRTWARIDKDGKPGAFAPDAKRFPDFTAEILVRLGKHEEAAATTTDPIVRGLAFWKLDRPKEAVLEWSGPLLDSPPRHAVTRQQAEACLLFADFLREGGRLRDAFDLARRTDLMIAGTRLTALQPRSDQVLAACAAAVEDEFAADYAARLKFPRDDDRLRGLDLRASARDAERAVARVPGSPYAHSMRIFWRGKADKPEVTLAAVEDARLAGSKPSNLEAAVGPALRLRRMDTVVAATGGMLVHGDPESASVRYPTYLACYWMQDSVAGARILWWDPGWHGKKYQLAPALRERATRWLAASWIDLGRYREARLLLADHAKDATSDGIAFERGRIAYGEKRPRNAEKHFRRITSGKLLVNVNRARAFIGIERDRWERASRAASKVAELEGAEELDVVLAWLAARGAGRDADAAAWATKLGEGGWKELAEGKRTLAESYAKMVGASLAEAEVNVGRSFLLLGIAARLDGRDEIAGDCFDQVLARPRTGVEGVIAQRLGGR